MSEQLERRSLAREWARKIQNNHRARLSADVAKNMNVTLLSHECGNVVAIWFTRDTELVEVFHLGNELDEITTYILSCGKGVEWSFTE